MLAMLNLEDQYCKVLSSAVPDNDPCVAVFPLSSLRLSWGFGSGWFSPMGPLRSSGVSAFDRLPGEQNSVFEFTIGNFFDLRPLRVANFSHGPGRQSRPTPSMHGIGWAVAA